MSLQFKLRGTLFFMAISFGAFGISPTFSSISQEILSDSCVMCHSGDQPAKGIDISSYDNVLRSGAVVPQNAPQSMLFQVVQTGTMPKEGNRLSAEQVQAIEQWINEGAQNN